MDKELETKVSKLSVEELFELREAVEKLCSVAVAKVGQTVHVVNVSSWAGWTGKLVKVSGPKAYIELEHKQKGKQVYPTALANVRLGEYPKSK